MRATVSPSIYPSLMITSTVSRVARFGRSFRHAGRGLRVAGRGTNLRVQFVAAGTVTFLAVACAVTGTGLGLVVVAIATVLSAEIANTAIERTCDLIADLNGIGIDPRIRDIKDMAAAAVLVVSAGAAVTGVIVFWPGLAAG
jgi:diacylglycerol kinase